VVVFAEGGRKGTIWLPEGRKGGSWARVADEMRKLISFLGPKDRTLGSEASSDCLGGSSSQMGDYPPSYAAMDLRGLDLFPESWCREVDDGLVAVNCFELEKQPHGSTEMSVLLPCSQDSPFVPMDLGLLHRPLGKKETTVTHSARGAKPAHLNSNLRAWIKLYVSFNRVLGRAVGKLLGRSAGSGLGSKHREVRLGRFLPKPIHIASFMSKHSGGAGQASSVFLGCPRLPESTSSTFSGAVPVLSSFGGESSSLQVAPVAPNREPSSSSPPSYAPELQLLADPAASSGSVPLPTKSGVVAVAPDQSRQKVKVEEKKSAKNLFVAPPGKKSANTAIAHSALSDRAREKVLEFWDRLPVERAKDSGRREKFLAFLGEMMAR
jgi:hypothetical protein